MDFAREPVLIDPDALEAAQVEAIRSDPFLVVAEAAAAEGGEGGDPAP